MDKKREINPGGIIGTKSGRVDLSTPDWQLVRERISAEYQKISPKERVENAILGLLYRMARYFDDENPKEIVPAGTFLKELVEIVGVSHKEFANYIGLKNSNLSSLYSGKRRISKELALKLGFIFDMAPAIWLNLQVKVELLQMRQENEKEYQKYRLKDLLKDAS